MSEVIEKKGKRLTEKWTVRIYENSQVIRTHQKGNIYQF